MIRFGIAILAGLGMLATSVQAAPTNWGDYSGNTVDYLQVIEDSGTDPGPLFGAPTIAGDSITFSPTGFNSTSSGAAGVDITDGTLSFMIDANPGSVINFIDFSEAGDFTLTGLGGLGTLASVSSSLFVNIVEIDNVSVNPILIISPLVFAPSNGDWNLQDDGPGPLVNGTWTGDTLIDLVNELVVEGVSFTQGVTKVNVTLDNTLATLSEAGTASFIAKKNVNGITITALPEPTVALLIALGLTALALRRQ